jgi:hypothetical protein
MNIWQRILCRLKGGHFMNQEHGMHPDVHQHKGDYCLNCGWEIK